MRTDGAWPREGDETGRSGSWARGVSGGGEERGRGAPGSGAHDGIGGEAPERAWVWPAAIIIGLLLVMVINAAYIVVAVGGADEVVESYLTEER